jgi:hypothetical protein
MTLEQIKQQEKGTFEAIEREYPMALESWSTEDWKKHMLNLIETTHQATVDEIIQKIIDIEITKDNGDYELAQLRYREKVIKSIKK